MKTALFLIGLLAATTGWAQGVPNTFTSGTPALAGEVNENFTSLDSDIAGVEARTTSLETTTDGLIDTITVTESATATGDYIAIAYCPTGQTAISANCYCGGDGVNSNWGQMILCASGDDGNGAQGAAAGCDIDFSYDSALASPPAEVSATCVEVVDADGSISAKSPSNISSPQAPGVATGFAAQAAQAHERITNRASLLSSRKE